MTKTLLELEPIPKQQDDSYLTSRVVTNTYQQLTQLRVRASRSDRVRPPPLRYLVLTSRKQPRNGDNAISAISVLASLQALSEMTGHDMPNHGGATYSGGWIAHVQAADPDGNGGFSGCKLAIRK